MNNIPSGLPHEAPLPYQRPLSSAGKGHNLFHGPTWTDHMTAPSLESQTIVLPKGVSHQELYSGQLHPDANHSDQIKAEFGEARAKYADFLGGERNGRLTGESLTHKISPNRDGSAAVTVKRQTFLQQSLSDHYHELRNAGIPRSVAGTRTAAFAHNKSVRGLANLARLHPAAATAAAVGVIAIAVAALASPPRDKQRHR